jgi:hypothetical protein
MRLVSSHELSDEQCLEIAALHLKSLPWTFNSKQGLPHMTRLYQSLQSLPFVGVLAIISDGKIVSSVSWTDDLVALKRHLRKKFWKSFFLYSLRHPVHVLKFVFYDRFTTRTLGRGSSSAYLLTLFTDSNFRGKGLASILINTMVNAIPKGTNEVFVDVAFEASAALAVYRYFGFKIVAQNSKCWMLKLDLGDR